MSTPASTHPRFPFVPLALLVLLFLIALAGCARTSLRTPDGLEYLGEKNVSAELIRVKKFHPNGSPMLDVEIRGLTSDPTAVNQGTVQAVLGTVGAALSKVPDPPPLSR